MVNITTGSRWQTKPQYIAESCVVTAMLGEDVHYSTSSADCVEPMHRFVAIWEPTGTINAVDKPRHYQVFPDKEAIEIIASSMTTEQFYGYCLGNFLKYRLRIGAKDEVQQELGKSNKYKELYEKHKHLCK